MSTERLSDDQVAVLGEALIDAAVSGPFRKRFGRLVAEWRDLRAETAALRTLLRKLVATLHDHDVHDWRPLDADLAATLDATLEGDDTDG